VPISLPPLFTSLISHRLKPRDLSCRLTARPIASSFTTDALVSAPTLGQLEELGRATRKPRQVDNTDTQNGDTVFPAGMVNLLWGGEPFQEFDWIPRLPNDDRYGYAVMEQRLSIRPDPIKMSTAYPRRFRSHRCPFLRRTAETPAPRPTRVDAGRPTSLLRHG